MGEVKQDLMKKWLDRDLSGCPWVLSQPLQMGLNDRVICQCQRKSFVFILMYCCRRMNTFCRSMRPLMRKECKRGESLRSSELKVGDLVKTVDLSLELGVVGEVMKERRRRGERGG